MKESEIHVEVTTLIVPHRNDSPGELRQIADFIADVSVDIPWHVSRFHPDYKVLDGSPTPVETIRRAVEIGKDAGLHYVFGGNVPMAGLEDTVCPHCGGRVIERRGFSILNVNLNDSRCAFCGEPLAIVTDGPGHLSTRGACGEKG